MRHLSLSPTHTTGQYWRNLDFGKQCPHIMKNTFRFNPETGQIDADIYIQATCDLKCSCGNPMSISINLPEGLVINASINIADISCNACGAPITLPAAHYWVENYKLMSKPLCLDNTGGESGGQ